MIRKLLVLKPFESVHLGRQNYSAAYSLSLVKYYTVVRSRNTPQQSIHNSSHISQISMSLTARHMAGTSPPYPTMQHARSTRPAVLQASHRYLQQSI